MEGAHATAAPSIFFCAGFPPSAPPFADFFGAPPPREHACVACLSTPRHGTRSADVPDSRIAPPIKLNLWDWLTAGLAQAVSLCHTMLSGDPGTPRPAAASPPPQNSQLAGYREMESSQHSPKARIIPERVGSPPAHSKDRTAQWSASPSLIRRAASVRRPPL